MPVAAELSLPSPEKRFFKSPDVAVSSEKPIRIKAGQSELIPVFIYPEHFPGPGAPEPDPDNIFESTRSAWIQRGLSVRERVARDVYLQWRDRPAGVRLRDPLFTSIPAYNLGGRDLYVGGRFCNFYVDGPRLNGDNLVRNVGKLEEDENTGKPILVSGTPGEDWKWIYSNGHNSASTVVGIFLKIDKDSRMWIPGDPKSRKGITLPNYDGSRKHNNEFLAAAPKTGQNIFWIGKTVSKLVLPANVHAVLGKAVVSEVRKTELDQLNEEGLSTQQNSRLLEGRGKTHWEIILEVYGPTDDDMSAHYVAVFFSEEK